MYDIHITVNGQTAVVQEHNIIVSDAKNYLNAVFTFSSEWDGMTKTAIFTRKELVKPVLLTDDRCVIPWEVIKQGGFVVSVVGMANGTVITTSTVSIEPDLKCIPFPVMINETSYSAGDTINPPTVDIYDQIINMLINSAEQAREAIKGEIDTIKIDASNHLIVTNKAGQSFDFGYVKGDKGDKGDPFIYTDFTSDQLLGLKGPKGDPFVYDDFTADQLTALKGAKGDPFVYTDFTPAQLAALTGPKGDKGDPFIYTDFTADQLLGLKGDKGDAFKYTDFTADQLAVLKGPQGDPGAAATIAAGTVTSGDIPSVSNVGTPTAAKFNFVLPKGDKGDKMTYADLTQAEIDILASKVAQNAQNIDLTPYAKNADLAVVAKSGLYSDLSGKPDLSIKADKTYVDSQDTSLANQASTALSTHNAANNAHSDIRTLIADLTTRLNALANSDDTTLDQLSEIVAYIKSNRTLIESVTTDKVSVSAIINNLTTNVANQPLSAAQGVSLKALIDALTTTVNGKAASATTLAGYGIGDAYTKTEADNKLSGKAAVINYSSTIGTSWTDNTGYFTQNLTISGLLASDMPTVDYVPVDGAKDETIDGAWSKIYKMTVTADDTLKIYTSEALTVSIPIQIKVVR